MSSVNVVAAAGAFVDVMFAGAVALPEALPVETEDSSLGVDQPASFVAVAASLLPVPHGRTTAFLDVRVLT